MNAYIVAVDGGGTKTLARLTDSSGQKLGQWQAGPAHLTNDLAGALDTLQQLLTTVLQESDVAPAEIKVVIGIAGAGDDGLKRYCEMALQAFDFKQVLVTTDAKTSLYGANAGQPVVAVALGTGSVAMRLDDHLHERQFGGWGFNIGDEGGGAALGKAAVRSLLWDLDRLPSTPGLLSLTLGKTIGFDKNQLLVWLRQANANQYAALAPAVIQMAEQGCPQALQVLKKHAADVETLILISHEHTNLPVVILGGLAKVTVPYLSETVQQWIIPSKGDALDGAFLLACQLQNTKPDTNSLSSQQHRSL